MVVIATPIQPLQPLVGASGQAAPAAAGTPWWMLLLIPIVICLAIFVIYKLLKSIFPPLPGSATKEKWEERVRLTMQMHVPGCESVVVSGSGRYPSKRLGWSFGPLYDREYEYVGFTKGFFPMDSIPIKFINKWFRRPYKLPLFGWVVKPYLIRGRPTRIITRTVKTSDGKDLVYNETMKGDFSLPGKSIVVFCDGFDTFQDDLYFVPNWSDITGEESIRNLQVDAILKSDRILADQYRDRTETLAKSTDNYFQSKFGRVQNIPVQQNQPQYNQNNPQTPPGQ